MKLIHSTKLVRRQKRTVHCEIELCQIPGEADAYLVNLRQGRDGGPWRESTRTPQPLALQGAESLFDQVLAERRSQGFADPAENPVPAMPLTNRNQPSQPSRQADDVLLARLQASPWRQLSESQRSRCIWRIGERRLADAVPVLVELLGQGDAMRDYCLAWAIGRCGDPGAASAMRALQARGETDAVRRIAKQAWLNLVDAETRLRHADALIADWPALLRAAWASQSEAAFADAVAASDAWKTLELDEWLEQLDQVARSHALARRVLLAQLRSLPVRAGVFRALRHLYKAAEMREDGELFGLLHRRFETTPPSIVNSWAWVSINRRYVRYSEEVIKPNSRVAFSADTREYLRRRSWRTLRRLGEDGDPGFVALALGALHAMDERDAGQPYSRAQGSGPAREHGPYSHWMLFNRLLHAHGAWRSNRNGRTWYKPAVTVNNAAGAASADAREEAFPALWDARPDALLFLLQTSNCLGVHEFAARALIDNQAFCAQIAIDILRRLMQCPYPASARLAFGICRQRFEPGVPGTDWLLLFLQSALPEARQYALDCISRDPARHGADTALVGAVLCASDETTRRFGRMLCLAALNLPGQADAITLHILDWLENCGDLDDAEQTVPAIAADLLWLLDQPLRPAAAQAPYARLLALLAHELFCVCALAAEWLLRHALPVSTIPVATLGALLQAENPALRAIGVKLFGALPDHVLSAQPALFATFCTHPHADVRRAIDPALQRMAGAHPQFCAALLPALLDCLFRGETAEGVHADLLLWIQGALKSALDALDRDSLMRLLLARGKGAQQLGALLLPDPRFAARDFSVREWAALGGNQTASVRRWALQAFAAHPERVRESMEDGLRLLDSAWDDSRAFACEFFTSQCGPEDWIPKLLVSLCDHADPQVQRFGRTMLSTHFNVADVTEYMLKLSQHPSANMQLFVSGWLESAAAGDIACLRRLEPYFLAVLSQVNRGRVVKNRVLAFLRGQAMDSEDIAEFVAKLFARQVVSVAIADKAQYIEGLRAIQARYPALPAVLSIQAPRGPAPHRHLAGAERT